MDMPVKQTKNLRHDQQGFASIAIALVLIVILALLTVGFAQLARREQQNALDKQLASQAYYSAESGVNDVYQKVQQAIANPLTAVPSLQELTPIAAGGLLDPTKCLDNQTPSVPGLPNSTVGSTGASYSCVLLNIAPPNLVWSGVSPDSDRSVTFSTTGALDSLTVFWASHDAAVNFKSSVSGFTPLGSSWGGSPAVLEVSLTPLPTPLDRTSLINNTFHVFLYPSTGDGSVSYSTDPTKQGQIIGGQCNNSGATAYPCSVVINSIGGSSGQEYLIQITDYYDQSDISVGNAKQTDGTKLDFKNGQAQIDVTGKARTVLKRIQVRAPIEEKSPLPPYAVQGQNVCKRFSTFPGSLTPDALSPSCQLN